MYVDSAYFKLMRLLNFLKSFELTKMMNSILDMFIIFNPIK